MGDRFYLCDNQILCEYDYEERLVFAVNKQQQQHHQADEQQSQFNRPANLAPASQTSAVIPLSSTVVPVRLYQFLII